MQQSVVHARSCHLIRGDAWLAGLSVETADVPGHVTELSTTRPEADAHVILNLADEQALVRGWEALHANIRRANNDLRLVLVEKMAGLSYFPAQNWMTSAFG
jgi:hypothetical protein